MICIDPGHPSETNSARVMQHGTNELTMNWQVALRLEKILKEKYRINVVMTKQNRDQFVRNRERAFIANRAHAALTIHLHCDCGPNHGFTVYYPNHKGKSEGHEGPSDKIIEASRHAAYALHDGMTQVLKGCLKNRGVRGEDKTKYGRKKGALTVSAYSEVPTLTIEMVFLSNSYDAAFIKSEAGQQSMARALANGIMEFLQSEKKKK